MTCKSASKRSTRSSSNKENAAPALQSVSRRSKRRSVKLGENDECSPTKKPFQEINVTPNKSSPPKENILKTPPPPLQDISTPTKLLSHNNFSSSSPAKYSLLLQSPFKSPSTKKNLNFEPKVVLHDFKSPMKLNHSPVKTINLLAKKSPLKHSSTTPLKHSSTTPLKHSSTTPLKHHPTTPQKQSSTTPLKHSPPIPPLKQCPTTPPRSILLDSPRKCEEVRRSPRKHTTPSKLISGSSLSSPFRKLNIGKSTPNKLRRPDVSLVCQALSCPASTLVCREAEIKSMSSFLEEHLAKGGCIGGSMYISGSPGTGKTAALTHVLANLKELKGISPHWVNCMGMQCSSAVYQRIAKELALPPQTTEIKNRRAIEKHCTSSKKPLVLILDEIDQLESKEQEVLYTLFEWPALKQSRLVLLAIANRLDLTERVLPRLSSGTCAPTRLHFAPYTKQQIISIISHRLDQTGCNWQAIIKPAALQLLAGKIASVAGDARKALEVCRRAVENCHTLNINEEERKAVDVGAILRIFNEIYGSRIMATLAAAPATIPLQQKMLLCCLLLVQKHSKVKDTSLGKLQEIYTKVCTNRQIPCVDAAEFQSLCSLLQSRSMIAITKNKNARMAKVSLLLDATEVEKILADKDLLHKVLHDKEALGRDAKKTA